MKTGTTPLPDSRLPVNCQRCVKKHLCTALAYLLEYKVTGIDRCQYRAIGELVLAFHEGGDPLLRDCYNQLLVAGGVDDVILTIEKMLEDCDDEVHDE